VLYPDRSVERMFGDEPEELIGGELTAIVPDRFREDHTRRSTRRWRRRTPRASRRFLRALRVETDVSEARAGSERAKNSRLRRVRQR
jgi:hypothetical protein